MGSPKTATDQRPRGAPHPFQVLARAVPPDIWYELHPGMDDLIEDGRLSSLQLESTWLG